MAFDPAANVRLAEREDSGLRMIGSLGRDRAEASGELATMGQARPLRSETARELVTILPRRITRELPILTQELAESLPTPTPTSPVLAPRAASAMEASSSQQDEPTQRVVLPGSGVRAPSRSRRLLRVVRSIQDTGPGLGALLLIVLAVVLAGTAVLLRLRRHTPRPQGELVHAQPVAGEPAPEPAMPNETPGSAAGEPAMPGPPPSPSEVRGSGAAMPDRAVPGPGSATPSEVRGSGASGAATPSEVRGSGASGAGLPDRAVPGPGSPVAPSQTRGSGAPEAPAGPGRRAPGAAPERRRQDGAVVAAKTVPGAPGADIASPPGAGPGNASKVVERPATGDRASEAKALCDQASTALDEGDFARAFELAASALRLRRTARGYMLRARAEQRLGRVSDALSSLDAATELAPNAGAVWEQRGRVLWAARRHDEARAAFERFLELDPKSPRAPEVLRLLNEPR
jgi:hypothetical protein